MTGCSTGPYYLDTLCVPRVYTVTEQAIRVRVDPQLRKQFVDTCHALDRTASQVIRDFMRQFVSEAGDLGQPDLFDVANMIEGQNG